MSGTLIIDHDMGAQFPPERAGGDQVTSITPEGSRSWDGEEGWAGGSP